MVLNKNLQVRHASFACPVESCTNAGTISNQEINIRNMNVELVAQMFKNYRSNVLFHLEGKDACHLYSCLVLRIDLDVHLQPRTLSRTHHSRGLIMIENDFMSIVPPEDHHSYECCGSIYCL